MPYHVIRNNGNVKWLQQSCDLTLLNCFFGRAVKDKCYAKNPKTIRGLRAEIHATIAEIRFETIENVLKSVVVDIS